MIQRIQSLFLLLAALIGITVIFFPIYYLSVNGFAYDIYMTSIKNLHADIPPTFKINMVFHFIILISLIIISVGSIFFYKKRVLQMRLCRFGLIVNIVFVILLFMFADTIKNKFITELFLKPEQITIAFKAGSILPLIMVVLFFLAGLFIGKDEKLIRSADRLR